MDKLFDNIAVVLVSLIIITFLLGFGYLIVLDIHYDAVLKEKCIAAGMQYISSNCVR